MRLRRAIVPLLTHTVISIRDTQIHHYLHRMLDCGLDDMLSESILDTAANFLSRASNHQPCDVKVSLQFLVMSKAR